MVEWERQRPEASPACCSACWGGCLSLSEAVSSFIKWWQVTDPANIYWAAVMCQPCGRYWSMIPAASSCQACLGDQVKWCTLKRFDRDSEGSWHWAWVFCQVLLMRCYMNKLRKTLWRPCFCCGWLSFRISSSASWRFPKRLPWWRLNSENRLSRGCHCWSLNSMRPDSFWTILSAEWKSPSPLPGTRTTIAAWEPCPRCPARFKLAAVQWAWDPTREMQLSCASSFFSPWWKNALKVLWALLGNKA